MMLVLLGLAPQDEIRFRDVTEEAGLVEPLRGMMGHGAAWGDFDADGRPDLFVGGFCDRPNTISARLFRNAGKFERTGQVEIEARTSGAVFADLDGDGDLDLVAMNNAAGKLLVQSKLFRNDGGKFVEAGELPVLTGRNVGVFDYDGDGLLDLLVLEDRLRNRSPKSVLLRNRGGFTFEDSRLLPEGLYGLGCAVADLNDDGRPDFFVGHANRLFLSKDGRYVEKPDPAFEWKPVDGEDWPCGAAFGDLDRDGDLDLVIGGHHDPGRVRVLRNDRLTFTTILEDTIPTKAPHVEFQDFDNDGWPDLYVSAARKDGTPLIYRNREGTLEVPKKGAMVYYPAGPTADYDGDGRLDLFLVNWFEGDRCHLLRNESAKRHWLQVRGPIGTKIRVQGAAHEISTGYGYASGQPIVAHIGLGDAGEAEVEIARPGTKPVLKRVKANQVIE
jgi:hypothetical protein